MSGSPQRRGLACRARDQRGMTMIELLMAASISVVITAMILVSWFALSRSYATTVKREKVSDSARFAVARMEREIRDAEQPPATVSECAIVRARPFYVELYTTFNKAGNQFANVTPRLVMYRLYWVDEPSGTLPHGQLWRFQDLNNNARIDGVDESAEGFSSFDLDERFDGEGGQLLVDNVVNQSTPSATSPTPTFNYIYYIGSGEHAGDLDSVDDLRGTANRLQIRAVEINLLLDMNPGRSPVYTHLRTTAQLRNTR